MIVYAGPGTSKIYTSKLKYPTHILVRYSAYDILVYETKTYGQNLLFAYIYSELGQYHGTSIKNAARV